MGRLLPVRCLTTVLLLVAACQRVPRPLVAGVDACDYCRMTVSDTRFGGEIESRTGQIHTFDAVECLASYYLDATERGDVRRAWVSDFETSDLVLVDSAVFVAGGSLNSPMGQGLAAFAPGPDATVARYGGRVLRWGDVLDMMKQRHLSPGVPDHATSTDAAHPPR